MPIIEFDTSEYVNKTTTGRKAVPAGIYTVAAEYQEVKITKNGKYHRLEVLFQIVKGPHSGHTIYHGFNYRLVDDPDGLLTKEHVPCKITHDQLVSWGMACGHEVEPQQVNTDPLMNVPCEVNIEVDVSKEYGDRNAIKGWRIPSSSTKKTSVSKKTLATADATSPAESDDDDSANPWC
jgi:hypothetical protein